jgi:hypothetical protein
MCKNKNKKLILLYRLTPLTIGYIAISQSDELDFDPQKHYRCSEYVMGKRNRKLQLCWRRRKVKSMETSLKMHTRNVDLGATKGTICMV